MDTQAPAAALQLPDPVLHPPDPAGVSTPHIPWALLRGHLLHKYHPTPVDTADGADLALQLPVAQYDQDIAVVAAAGYLQHFPGTLLDDSAHIPEPEYSG